MSDDLLLDGKSYVSSKKAAELTGYARDYIGQLSRAGLIDAERVGGLWYVSMDSLENYEKNAEIARSFSPVISASKEGESSLSFEGKEYISASRASKLTGYNQDYVGQLARGGKIPSKQIGNRWYVDRVALVDHKNEKDALLAAVQAESVGLRIAQSPEHERTPEVTEHVLVLPQLSYTHESSDLFPLIPEKLDGAHSSTGNFVEIRPQEVPGSSHTSITRQVVGRPRSNAVQSRVKRPRKRVAIASVGLLTIILVLSVSFVGLKGSSTFAQLKKSQSARGMSASAAEALGGIGDVIERWVAPELSYVRSN